MLSFKSRLATSFTAAALVLAGSTLAFAETDLNKKSDPVKVTVEINGEVHEIDIDLNDLDVSELNLDDMEINIEISEDFAEVIEDVLEEVEIALAEVEDALEEIEIAVEEAFEEIVVERDEKRDRRGGDE
jgi:hypothetical protein